MTQAEALLTLVRDMMGRKFYGELAVKFEAGRIVIVRATESLKLPGEPA